MKEKRQQALDFILSHPVTFGKLVFMRAAFWWWEPVPSDFRSKEELAKFGFSIGLTVLALLGVFKMLRDRRPACSLFAGILLLFPVPYLLTHVSGRFRHPVETVMVVSAAFALIAFFWKISEKT